MFGRLLKDAAGFGFAIGKGDGCFADEVVVAGVNFSTGAEDHAGHAGVIVSGDGLIFFELHEADGEVEAFFEVFKIDIAFFESGFDLGESFLQQGIFAIQAQGEGGDFFEIIFLVPVVEVLLGRFLGNGGEKGIPVHGAIFRWAAFVGIGLGGCGTERREREQDAEKTRYGGA